jgi:hypothetical protein
MVRPSRSLIPVFVFVPISLLLIGFLIFREQTTKRPDQLAVTTAGMSRCA